MLRVGRVRAATKRQEAASAQKAIRHFAARLGQAHGFAREKEIIYFIPREQALLDVCGKFDTGGNSVPQNIRL
jgi:hypothetical protein